MASPAPCVPAERGWSLELLRDLQPRVTGGFLPAGEERVPGERVAGAALHPGLVGASHWPRARLHPEQGSGTTPALPALPWTGWDALTSTSPCKAGAGAHAPGAADRPRHLPHRHRAKTHRARRAVERQPLPRDLQPLLLQVHRRPATLTPRGEPGVGTPLPSQWAWACCSPCKARKGHLRVMKALGWGIRGPPPASSVLSAACSSSTVPRISATR